MSGKRHHVIPQFLIRPFSGRTQNGQHYVWVFGRGKNPYETNTINVFVERSYYSEGEDTAADDSITALESKFANMINDLLVKDAGPIDESDIFEFFSHLEIRNRNFRKGFSQASSKLIEQLLNHIEQPGVVESMLFQSIRKKPELIVSKMMQDGHSRKEAKRVVNYLVRHKSEFLEQSKNQISQLINFFRTNLPKKILDSAKSGHLKILADGIPIRKRIDTYRHLELSIVEIESGELILGDNPVLFENGNNGRYAFFTSKENKINSLLFPLSPYKLLFGSDGVAPPDISTIRKIIASHSATSFISQENSQENRDLLPLIGTKSELISKEEISTIAENLLREAMGN